MPVVEPSTQNALRRRWNRQSLRSIADDVGVSPPVVSRALRGIPISRQNENIIRRALKLDVLPVTVEVCTCPTCGNVHALDDCNGKAGKLAIVGDGERIAPAPQPARSRTPRKQVQVSEETHRRLLRLRDEGGYRSIEAAVMALLGES